MTGQVTASIYPFGTNLRYFYLASLATIWHIASAWQNSYLHKLVNQPRCRSSGVEHSLGKGEAGSSILPGSTSFKDRWLAVGKLLSTNSFKAGQLAFVFLKDKPSRWHLPTLTSRSDAQVAQLVEQRTENPRVGGSIPPLGTKFLIFINKINVL